MRRGHQCALLFQVGNLETRQARLRSANHITRPSHLQIFLGNEESILRISHDPKPPLGRFAQRGLVHQQACRSSIAAPDPPAQLMHLCQSKIFRTLNHHDRRIGYIYPHLNHRRGDQDLCLTCHKICHRGILLRGCQLPMDQTDVALTKSRAQNFEPLFCRGQIHSLTLFNQWANPIGLATRSDRSL